MFPGRLRRRIEQRMAGRGMLLGVSPRRPMYAGRGRVVLPLRRSRGTKAVVWEVYQSYRNGGKRSHISALINIFRISPSGSWSARP